MEPGIELLKMVLHNWRTKNVLEGTFKGAKQPLQNSFWFLVEPLGVSYTGQVENTLRTIFRVCITFSMKNTKKHEKLRNKITQQHKNFFTILGKLQSVVKRKNIYTYRQSLT